MILATYLLRLFLFYVVWKNIKGCMPSLAKLDKSIEKKLTLNKKMTRI